MARKVSPKAEHAAPKEAPSAPAPAKSTTALMSRPAAPLEEGLEVIYDKVESLEYSTTSEHGPVTARDMKRILGWVTEEEWVKQKMEEHPESKPDAWLFYDDFHCLNTDGKKVRCLNNAGNRPFDMDWCKDIQHMILHGMWAGPYTVPGETVNGESIRISRYGRCLSVQHSGTALVLAQELLDKSRQALYYDPKDPETEKYKFWTGVEELFIETFIVTGLSEDQRVIRTVDYVKPRSEADMLYTMELFRKNTPAERKEMTKMLAAAIDLLWTRTDAKGYRTHPEIVGFLERHMRLLECVEHLFIENTPLDHGGKKRRDGETEQQFEARKELMVAQGGRRLSKLRLNPGDCSALLFLMGSSATGEAESDAYRNQKPPTQDHLDWSRWERAKEFWTQLAGDDRMKPVRVQLNRLVETKPTAEEEDEVGLGGRAEEKLAVLAQAWRVFKDHWEEPFPYTVDKETKQIECTDLVPPDGELSLCYTDKDDKGAQLPEGKIKLVNVADFFGIDCPAASKSSAQGKAPPTPPPPTPEQIEERAAEQRQIRENEADKKKEQSKQRRVARKP